MKSNSQHRLLSLAMAFAAMALVATGSFAETPKSTDENATGQMMYPGMYGGMGPGYRGYGQMGPGYMRGGMGYGYGMGMMGGGMGYGMMQVLNLDKDQRSKIRALMREQRTANCKVMNEMMDVRDELAAEYDKPQPDTKVIGKLLEKMQGMQRQMFERAVDMRNKMRGLLNKEQKENFDRLYHYRGGMMGYGGMMGPGMMGPGMMGPGMMGPGMMGPGMMWDSAE